MDQLAAGFVALGLKKGDRVGMWGPNMRAWILTQYATARAGLLQVMLLIDSFCYSGFYIQAAQAKYGNIMPIVVRVENFKNLQKKACRVLWWCYFFFFLLWDSVKKITAKYPGHLKWQRREGRQAYFANS